MKSTRYGQKELSEIDIQDNGDGGGEGGGGDGIGLSGVGGGESKA